MLLLRPAARRHLPRVLNLLVRHLVHRRTWRPRRHCADDAELPIWLACQRAVAKALRHPRAGIVHLLHYSQTVPRSGVSRFLVTWHGGCRELASLEVASTSQRESARDATVGHHQGWAAERFTRASGSEVTHRILTGTATSCLKADARMIARTKVFPRVETALILDARDDLYALKDDSNGPGTNLDDGASRLRCVQKEKQRPLKCWVADRSGLGTASQSVSAPEDRSHAAIRARSGAIRGNAPCLPRLASA